MNAIVAIELAFFFVVVFVILYANRRLKELKEREPSLLDGVGIKRIDWWGRCIIGIFRLGYVSSDTRLKPSDRVLFKGVILIYLIIIAGVIYYSLAPVVLKWIN